jgi:hypothetical protein
VTSFKRITLVLSLCACLAAAGCGSDDEGGKQIPAATAAALEAQLDKVQERLDNGTEGACKDILEAPTERGPNRAAVQQLLDGLPNDVDPDVREATQESFDNLWSLVESKCQELQADEPAQTTPTDTQTDTTPTETETQPTETTPPPTDTEPTTPDQQPLPPEGDGDNGGTIPPDENGNGNGNGSGGGVGPGAAKENKEKGE